MNLNTSPQRKKILITVKTYPTLSSKHDELVCTAGVTEGGEWIRLYPVPFRKLEFDKQYKKYQWVELEVEKRTQDPRPESYKPLNIDQMVKGGYVDTKDNWSLRKSLVLKNVYDDTDKLIAANKNDSGLSLAVFKPTEIVDFTIEPCDKEWDKKKLNKIKARANQLDLFGEKSDNIFEVVRKLPYRFKYKFKDINGKESHIMVEDWELGQLFWNCLSKNGDDESVACKKVKQKYLEEFREKDLYFYMGTTRQFDGWSKNPFLIIGVFYPPKTSALPLF